MPPPVSPLPPPPPAGTTPGSLGGLLGAVSVDFCVGPVEGGAESLPVAGPEAGEDPDAGEGPDEGEAPGVEPDGTFDD